MITYPDEFDLDVRLGFPPRGDPGVIALARNPIGTDADQTCDNRHICLTNQTNCHQVTCTCDTNCGQATCVNTCTCHTNCGQDTCANTCTCNTNCDQATCANTCEGFECEPTVLGTHCPSCRC